MTEPRLVMCKKLGKELPGLSRPPYKNELGKRIFEEVSKEAWDMWIKDSVKYINTYRVDLTSPEGQVIPSSLIFRAGSYAMKKEAKLKAGVYVLKADYSMADILRELTEGEPLDFFVNVIPGETSFAVSQKLNEAGITEAVRSRGVRSPAVIVVGAVAGLADDPTALAALASAGEAVR